jgi:anti-sigma-K factor RskA
VNVKEYINSGLVESYVLGLATDAERLEFEQVCATYPEIAEARDAFERSLENQLIRDAITPPSFIKEKIQQQISSAANSSSNLSDDVIADTPVRRMNVWRLLAAACFVGLLGVGYWAYTTNEKYQNALAKQSATEKELQQSTAQLESLQQQADMMTKPGVKMVALKGTANAPQAQTTIFWDTTGTRDVYLMINNLPQPATDKQYQLWAIIDKQPVDLGMIDYEANQKRLLLRMKNVQNAQAFAITLEQRGRSNTEKPEGQMYVLGNL